MATHIEPAPTEPAAPREPANLDKATVPNMITTPVSSKKRRSLWRDRNFNIFWLGQTLSSLGDAFALIAVPLLVLQATGSVAQMGLVTATFGLGQVVSGLVAGIIVDRVNRRHLMIFCDVGRLLVYAAIPVGWGLLGPQMWLIYAVTAVGSCLGMCFQVGFITAVANLVDRQEITGANGRLQTTMGVAFVAGPALAGLVSGWFGPAAAIGIDAASFGVSAFSLLFIRLRPTEPAKVEEGDQPGGFVQEWLAGARFLWRQPVLRAVTFLIGAYSFLTVGTLDMFIYHVKHDLGQDDQAVGLVFGFASVGSILGALVVATARRRLGFGVCLLGGMAVQSAALALAGQAPAILLLLPMAMVFTGSESIKGVTSMSLRQEITPSHLLGRVTSVFWTCVTVPGPVGGAILTALAERTSVGLTSWLAGGLGLLVAGVGVLTAARQRNPEEAYRVAQG